ncbi:hypothetical protein B0T36_05000 [Nocardia donostiensis]|uniref:hypothetical protein n=1 Tax=Nocardia donostiensis TaxID=1538463 RepID=UPI0009D95418|nr:hypothetical protein [Nocardia donostiensis]OQS16152.1 hypothetical protein B0T36_05000 [Nocardia donostiensis]
MPTAFRDPCIPDGEKSVYSVRLADRPQGFEMTNIVAGAVDGYRATLEACLGSGNPGGTDLALTIEQRFKRVGERLRAEHYRAETRAGGTLVSREEANFLDTHHLQFGGAPAPFPLNVMPIAAGLTLLRGLDFAEGHAETIDVWLAFSVHWPLIVRVEKRVTTEVPAGSVPCWQVRLRPGFAQVNTFLDKVIGGILPPFVAHFAEAAPHRLVRLSFPTQLALSGPRTLLELVS